MLNRIKLTNFRKHRSMELQFESGMVPIRGGNESGKSTILEAIAYALFGVKAIRTSLEEAVTYGEAVGTLKVELDLTVDGVLYTIKRGKSGAECTYTGGIVTGQTEVTGFVGKLLRVDAAAAARLVLSNQNEIRGALEAGPRATTEMIERLAEFDQIDHLVELIQSKLTLGSDNAAQAALSAAQARLDAARAVQEPDFEGLNYTLATASQEVKDSEDLAQEAQKDHAEAQAEFAKAEAQASECKSLEERAARLQTRYAAAMGEMQKLKANPVKGHPNADADIDALLVQKADIAAANKVYEMYVAVKPLLDQPLGRAYQGSEAAFDQERHAIGKKLSAAQESVGRLSVQIGSLTANLNSGNCGFCGQDFSALPEVAAKNAEIQGKIQEAEKELKQQSQWVEGHGTHLACLDVVTKAAKPYVAASQSYAAVLNVDTRFFPPILEWKGKVPTGELVTTASIDAQVREIRAAVQKAADWKAAIEKNDALLESFCPEREDIANRAEELAKVPNRTVGCRGAALKVATDALNKARTALSGASTALAEAKGALRDAAAAWARAIADIESAGRAVADAQAAVSDLAFNNCLLKRVRAARPLIADRLWNLVLAAVSSYFSELRGEPSQITKGADGFLVDGHSVATLSGSTLDILGLSIRVALVRTFLPASQFLLLDEPAAACDGLRTDNMLGFLVGSGFQQVLLVTHEDVSESIADQIINLGEVDTAQ